MTRMLRSNWKGGKSPCSCCCGGPVCIGRAGEKRQTEREIQDQIDAAWDLYDDDLYYCCEDCG